MTFGNYKALNGLFCVNFVFTQSLDQFVCLSWHQQRAIEHVCEQTAGVPALAFNSF